MKLASKHIINFSIFIAACSVALYYLLTPYRQQRLLDATLSEGCENFTVLFQNVTRNTRVMVLGEFHSGEHRELERQLVLRCGAWLMSFVLYGTPPTTEFFTKKHAATVYFEGAISSSNPVDIQHALSLDKNTFRWQEIAQHSSYWENPVAYFDAGNLIEKTYWLHIFEELLSAQQQLKVRDDTMLLLIKKEHSQSKILHDFLRTFDMGRMNPQKELFINNALSFLIESYEKYGKKPVSLKKLIAHLFSRIATDSGLHVVKNENATVLSDRILNSAKFFEINARRNNALLQGVLTAASQNTDLTLFIAGLMHVYELIEMLPKKSLNNAAFIGMKPFSEAHQMEMVREQANTGSLFPRNN